MTFYANEYPEEGAVICEEAIRIHVVPIPVPVDIKPTSCPNPLNVTSKGVLPVAILDAARCSLDEPALPRGERHASCMRTRAMRTCGSFARWD